MIWVKTNEKKNNKIVQVFPPAEKYETKTLLGILTDEHILSFSFGTIIALICLLSTAFNEILWWEPNGEWLLRLVLLVITDLSSDSFDVSSEDSSNLAKSKLETCNSW